VLARVFTGFDIFAFSAALILNERENVYLSLAKFDFVWGRAPDPAGEAYSTPPDPLAGIIRGAYF